MLKNYFKRSAMLLGAAAVAASAYAGAYVDVTQDYIKDAAFTPGWRGYIGSIANGVGEVFNGAFKLYQSLGVQPAGEYVLTVDALYRCSDNNYAKANQTGKPELNTAYIFINDKKEPVKGLFDGRDTAPDNTEQANEAFGKGEYKNTVKYDHKGGELVIGIANTGCYWHEWCCFDNFTLTCDGAPVAVTNGDFSTGIDAKREWNNVNSQGGEKTPDIQKENGGGNYRKCGGSPYKTAQQVELPAGKYYFSMLCFHRYGSTMDEAGNLYHHKWPGAKTDAYGAMTRSPKDWFTANDYDQITASQYSHAWIFMSKNADCPATLTYSDDLGDLTDDVDLRVRVKDCWEICNGNFAEMPDNNPRYALQQWHDENKGAELAETKNKCAWGTDSGCERESGAAFVNEGEKWRQGVEFTLDAPTKVWVGFGKDENTGDGYWHAYTDIKLEKWDDNAQSGVDSIALDTEIDENAPVEYFNMQGVRVAEPTTGLYIVRQGNKVSKQLIRK